MAAVQIPNLVAGAVSFADLLNSLAYGLNPGNINCPPRPGLLKMLVRGVVVEDLTEPMYDLGDEDQADFFKIRRNLFSACPLAHAFAIQLSYEENHFVDHGDPEINGLATPAEDLRRIFNLHVVFALDLDYGNDPADSAAQRYGLSHQTLTQATDGNVVPEMRELRLEANFALHNLNNLQVHGPHLNSTLRDFTGVRSRHTLDRNKLRTLDVTVTCVGRDTVQGLPRNGTVVHPSTVAVKMRQSLGTWFRLVGAGAQQVNAL